MCSPPRSKNNLRDARLSGNYQVVISRDGHLDNLEVRCELQRELSGRLNRPRCRNRQSLQHRIKTIIGVSTRISVLEVDGIPRTVVGKARRVIDERPSNKEPMNQAFICDAVRTLIGRYGGALTGVRADDLGAAPLQR